MGKRENPVSTSGRNVTRDEACDSADCEGVSRPCLSLLPRELSEVEFALFAEAGEAHRVEAGETIFRRGELGRNMFVVESGRIRLEFGDDLPDKHISAREYFGELALFVGAHGRMASAVAVEPSALRVIGRSEFDRLLATSPDLLARFMLRSFSYLVSSEQQLIQSLRRRNEDLMQTLDSLRRTRSELGTARQLSLSDELTCLANRRGMYEHLERLKDQPDQDDCIGLLLVDVDDFKQINDRHGHLTGDRVLQAVAEELRNAAGASDLPCRLGGDEFALLARASDSGDLAARALRLRLR